MVLQVAKVSAAWGVLSSGVTWVAATTGGDASQQLHIALISTIGGIAVALISAGALVYSNRGKTVQPALAELRARDDLIVHLSAENAELREEIQELKRGRRSGK